MFQFIITSNGHAVSHIPPFQTKAEAENYIIANISEPWAYDAKVVDLEADIDEPAIDVSLETKLARTQDALNKEIHERGIDQANIKMYLAIIEDQKAKFNGVRDYIQASINRGEWEDELDELFWHELAKKLDLDLGLTEEIDVTVTITYSGTITVPKDADLDDVEFDTTWHLTGNYLGEDVAELTYNDIEITRD